MRGHAKASSAGSTMARGAKLAIALAAVLVSLLLGAFLASAAPPTLAIDAPSGVETTKAHLSGEVTVPAEGPETYWGFEYAIEGSGAWSGFPFSGTVAAGESQTVSADLTGLAQNKKYEARLVGENFTDPSAQSAIVKFKTDPAPVDPTVVALPATEVSYASAKLSGTVDPEGGNEEDSGEFVPIHWSIQVRDFTEDGAFEERGSGDLTGADAESVDPVEVGPVELTGLTPGHTYRYFVLTSRAGVEVASLGFGEFTTLAVAPPVVSVPTVSALTGTTAHFSGEVTAGNSDPAFDSSCAFEYVTQAQFDAEGFAAAASLPCDVNPVTGTGSTPVQADATGLVPHTTYHLRLRAENQGGPTAVEAPDTFTTLAVAPAILKTFVSDVGTTGAKLNAQVNPGGDPTTYHFIYVTEAHFGAEGFTGATSTPESASIGEDNTEHAAEAELSGLAEDTAYRYRVIATNGVDTVEGPVRPLRTEAILGEPQPDTCPNAQFRAEQHATYLPDCRAYEQVTPSQKNGGDVLPNETRTHISPDGDRAIFTSVIGFGDVHGTGVSGEYMATRGANGTWSTHSISPPQDATGYFPTVSGLEPRFLEFSRDLSQGLLSSNTPLTAAPNVAATVNLYHRGDLAGVGLGSYRLLSDSPFLQPASSFFTGFWKPAVAATSADFTHFLFESRRNLTTDAPACATPESSDECPPLLYESVGDTTRLLGYVPAIPGETSCTGTVSDCTLPANGSQAGRGALEPNANLTERTLSADGSRAIFTVPSGPISPEGTLYVRDDRGTDTPVDDTTTQVDASEKASPESPRSAEFWAASSGVDGTGQRIALRVFFTSQEQLTEDDDNSTTDAFMWSEQPDFEGNHLTRLSVDHEPSDGIDPEVQGFAGVSEDGDYAYFVGTQDQLVAGGPTGATGGPYGGERIFVWHQGTLREVAAVNGGGEGTRLIGLDSPYDKRSRLSPDGTHLAFVTEGTDEALSLFGHQEPDHGSSCPSNASPQCNEVYVYDATANAGSGDLRCASCGPTGSADAGFGGIQSGIAVSGTASQNHAVSDDGRFVFFNTAAPLLEEDINGTLDAYSYDLTSGQRHLLSPGSDSDGSAFLEASPDGSSVLINTRAQLRASDVDRNRDLYDVRIGGGSAEPSVASECEPLSGNCQVSAGSSAAPTAQSSGQAGQGNLSHVRKRCSKGKRPLRRAGKVRCVKKKGKGNRPKAEDQSTHHGKAKR